MSTKKILVKGSYPDHWETYDDGSAMAVCVACGTEEDISEKKFEKLRNKPEWYKEYTCYPCWKRGNETAKHFKENSRQTDIQWGQSMNLAFQAALDIYNFQDPLFWEKVEQYQKEINEKISEMKSKVEE